MNPRGVFLILCGVWVATQTYAGILERLKILAPNSSSSSGSQWAASPAPTFNPPSPGNPYGSWSGTFGANLGPANGVKPSGSKWSSGGA